jgi:hypothetical protein
LFTILLVKNPELIGGISPELIHSYGFAPPRVMSLDLSIKYAPYITSCVYQDDFFPRVSTESMKKLFIATFALTGVVVFILWVKQAFQITHSDDPRRLYPPGKICHFVYKQPGWPGHHPIRARIVPSSQGRFERLVLSSSGTTKNHFVLTLCEHLKVRSSVLLSHGYVLECRVQHFAFCHQYPAREKFTYMRSECVIIVKRQMVVNDQHL